MQNNAPKQLQNHIDRKAHEQNINPLARGLVVALVPLSDTWRAIIHTESQIKLDHMFFQQSDFDYVSVNREGMLCVVCGCKVGGQYACVNCPAVRLKLKIARLTHQLAAYNCLLQHTSHDLAKLICNLLFVLTTHPDLRS